MNKMTEEELRDYNTLIEIQNLCIDAREWEGIASFENILAICSDELKNLKTGIGHRIISQEINFSKGKIYE